MKVRFSLKRLFMWMTGGAVICAVVAAVVAGIGREERIFESVQIGDTEHRLIQLLEDEYVAYNIHDGGSQALYYHSDGFLGICFYYVVDGRVVKCARD